MKKFDMMIWYCEEQFGKAWTTVEAETEEEARAIFTKKFEDGKEYELEWDFYAKGGDTSFNLDDDIFCKENNDGN
jgi:hypothetical protein